MKAKITLTFDIETDEYLYIQPTIESAKELVEAMINRQADFPTKIDIDVIEI
jgi:hypothetical protein